MGEIARRSLLGGLVAASVAAPARAAGWPERPIAWLLPFPAGGPTDAFSRPLGAYAGSKLGQTILIDNRSGAGGTVAAAAVARAAPDGYTMLVGYTGLTYASQLYPKAGFEFGRDFAPISAFGRVVQVLAINPARLDVSSLQQFIEVARKKPGGIDVASAGLGTVPHLALEMLQIRAGIKLNHVPYRGSAPAMQDLLAGQVDALFMPVASVAGLARTGKIRVLAVAGRRREPLLPDVPTFAEAGLTDFRASSWYGLFAPRQTPVAVLDRLHGVIQEALGQDEVKQIWAEQGARVELESREEFDQFVALDIERWGRIARDAKVQME